MIRALAAFLFLVTASAAWAQGSLLQGGPWAPGRAPMYVGQGSGQAVVQDSGPAGGGARGVGLSELGLTARGTGSAPFAGQGSGPLGTNFCDFDGPTTGPHHFLCLSANAQGGGLIAYGAGSGGTPLPFALNINGANFQITSTTTGQLKAAVAASLTNGLPGFFNWIPADINNTFNIAYNGSTDATSLSAALLAYMEASSGASPPGLGLSTTDAALELNALFIIAATKPR